MTEAMMVLAAIAILWVAAGVIIANDQFYNILSVIGSIVDDANREETNP